MKPKINLLFVTTFVFPIFVSFPLNYKLCKVIMKSYFLAIIHLLNDEPSILNSYLLTCKYFSIFRSLFEETDLSHLALGEPDMALKKMFIPLSCILHQNRDYLNNSSM